MVTTIDARRETVSLIGSDKVESAAVYGGDEQRLETVNEWWSTSERQGRLRCHSFGGFLGMDEDYYPMPWTNLKYDNRLGGYRVALTEKQLKALRSV
jgi:hypothetical protein